MNVSTTVVCLFACSLATSALAQPPKPDEGPGSDTQLGASFVGNSGNASTATLGADFSTNYRQPPWRFEAAASAVRNSGHDVAVTVERYLESARIKRDLTPIIAATAGERLEHDPVAGIDLRSIVDGGLAWKLVRQPSWSLDGITAIGWNHEHPIEALEIIAPTTNDAIAVLQLLSKIPIGPTGSTTQRVTWYPDFTRSDAMRLETELTAQAAMSQRIAVKVGYLIRYVRVPLPGLKSTDTTATASIVMTWKNPPAPPKAP